MTERQRFWRHAAITVCAAFVLMALGLTLVAASGRARPASFGTGLGPIYVAAFTAHVPACADDPGCGVPSGRESGVYYEVWLFHRNAPMPSRGPQINLLLRLPLRD